MESKIDILSSLRQLFQDLVAPEVREIRGDLKAVDARFNSTDVKIEGMGARLDQKIDTVGARLDQKIDTVGARLDQKIDSLSGRLDAVAESLRSDIKSSAASIVAALENAALRGQLEEKDEVAHLRERVTRLEERLQAKTVI